MKKVAAIVSGGLDSTTMLYDLINQDFEVTQAVSFNYGQRHKKELDFAQATCERLHVPWTLIDLWSSGLTEALSSSESSLISNNDVPEGHYAEENMKSTVVPNRNMIMISIAGGIAVAKDCDYVALGVHAGDHFIYPDCRPSFIYSVSDALITGNKGFGFGRTVSPGPILAPYINTSKADIALRALELGVPLEQTWSCYKGGDVHCGRCGTCVERLEAIHEAQAVFGEKHPYKVTPVDMTAYEDVNYWKEAVANA